MSANHSYILILDYGDRVKEREIVRQILNRYDRDSLVGCALFVNNNPYHLESYLCLNFHDKYDDFEHWFTTNFPQVRRNFRFVLSDAIDAMFGRGFNLITFVDGSELDIVMSGEPNEVYLYPDRDKMEATFGKPIMPDQFSVFLSHSSRDKEVVNSVFEALHKSEIRAWYDTYQIFPGDSITDRINEGLQKSTIGLIFLSTSFLDKRSGWPMNEANYFFQERMRDSDKNFVVLNVDLKIEQIPPLLRDYKFIDLTSPTAHSDIVGTVRRRLGAY